MTFTPHAVSGALVRPGSPAETRSPAGLPAWWRADQAQFADLIEKRVRIHAHEMAAARKGRSALATALFAAVSFYSIDATGAVSIPAGPGFLVLFLALAFPIIVAWCLDRRLTQQLSDIHLRSELWLDLVDAVKHGWIDVPQLERVPGRETDVERFLRKETALAARFLASRNLLVPYLPIFGHCLKLKSA